MIKRRMTFHCGSYFLFLKAKPLHGASCRVTEGRIEGRVCDPCELLPIGKGARKKTLRNKEGVSNQVLQVAI